MFNPDEYNKSKEEIIKNCSVWIVTVNTPSGEEEFEHTADSPDHIRQYYANEFPEITILNIKKKK